jgi:hypothetical protein
MTKRESDPRPADEGRFDSGWEGHRRRQARPGLALTPLQRLRWLEPTMDELRRVLGRARAARHAR